MCLDLWGCSFHLSVPGVQRTRQWNPSSRHVPATCWGRLTGQRRQTMRALSLENPTVEPIHQTCPSYMLRKTNWPEETDQAVCPENLTVEHILQTCPSYVLRTTNWSAETDQDRPSCVPREPDSGTHPADMSQLHVEVDWLASGDRPSCVPREPGTVEPILQTCPSYMLRKTSWPAETDQAVSLENLTVEHVLQTCPSNNTLRKTNRPTETPLQTELCGSQHDSPSRLDYPCEQGTTSRRRSRPSGLS